MRLARILFAFLVIIAVSAPAHAQDSYAEDIDPIEGFNRGIFWFNKGVDTAIIRPIAWGYKHGVPQYGRDRLGNFFSNLGEPVNFLNAALQGDVDQTFTTLWRFLINSTLGIGGLWDQAAGMGLQYRSEDFGQTLGHYGVGPGFYLVLPILGPSNGRDAVGLVADAFSNPVSYVEPEWIPIALAVGAGIHKRATYLEITDNIDNTSIDPYATYRSAYLQRRIDLINNGTPSYGTSKF